MTLRGYLRLGLGALIASNLVLGLIAVLLLSRLGPSFERVREERVITFVAAQDMLAVLASAGSEPLSPDARTRFQAALDRLRARPKTELESASLATLSELSQAVLAGDREATREVVATLDRWIADHRRALREQHAELEKLSTGGAWFLVFLTVFIVVATVVIARFVDARALVPLEEILQVIDASHAGDRLRRPSARGAPADLRRAAEALDVILETRAHRSGYETVQRIEAERAALLEYLDRDGDPSFVLDRAGEVVAANTAGLDLLSRADALELRSRFAKLATTKDERGSEKSRRPAIHFEKLGDGVAILCRLAREADE